MNRLNSSSCSIESGVIYLDIISNLERVSDHAVNIAQQVIAGRIVNKKVYKDNHTPAYTYTLFSRQALDLLQRQTTRNRDQPRIAYLF